ncbi:hypothetical protein ACP3TB_21345 (plasmid) [Rahnella variigena]
METSPPTKEENIAESREISDVTMPGSKNNSSPYSRGDTYNNNPTIP